MKSAKRIFALLLALLVAFPAMTMLTAVQANATSLSVVQKSCSLTLDAWSVYSDDGTKTTTETITDGKITAPSNPFKADDPANFAFAGWQYNGKVYLPGESIPLDSADKSSGTATITAKWENRSSTSTGSTVSSGSTIYGTFKSGVDGLGEKTYSYKSGTEFVLPENPFASKTGYTFKGWSVNGKTVGAGSTVSSSSDFAIYAVWEVNDRVVVNSGSSYSSSVSSSASSSSSSSSVASKPSSSSTAKPSSSSTAKPSSSSSSSTSIETSSEDVSSSVPETNPQPDVFEPIDLAYSISGNVPITKVNFLLNEDIGGTPQLWVTAIDSYTSVDAATSRFIADGDTLGAFDLSLLLDGSTYTGSSAGTVTYALNGTQSGVASNYTDKVLAIVHVTELSKFGGTSYYMTDGKNAYLYDIASGTKSEVSNISFDTKDGVSRPVIGDVNSLSSFAYLAADGIIVEVKLIPDANATEASLDVTGLSPIMLVNLEVGKASAAGTSLPIWLWIVIGAVVVVVIALVVFYFISRGNENKRQAKRQERLENYSAKAGSKREGPSSVTGFDD